MAHRPPRSGEPQIAQFPSDFVLLQVTPRLEAGGAEQASIDIAGLVARAGATALIASAGGALEGALARAGGRLLRGPYNAKDPVRIALNARRLESIIRTEAVSLVHVHSRAPAFSALRAARRTHVPLLTTYHGAYPASWWAKRRYNRIMTAGAAVIAPSHFIAGEITRQHPRAKDRIVVIPEGIDLDRFDPDQVSQERVAQARARMGITDADSPVLLLAGRLAASKGQSLSLAALARLPAAAGRPILVLAGAGEARRLARLTAVVARLGLSDQVRFTGAIDDMPAAWIAADLALAPSIVPEAFGRTAAEAAAMGRPVLATACGALAETMADGETGWLAESPDPDAFAAALAKALVAGGPEWARIGAAARRRAAHLYSLGAMADALFALYGRLVETRR
ncbi:MAG: glycosyltransferase family 4 protein [Caulobacteraceae bacterium]